MTDVSPSSAGAGASANACERTRTPPETPDEAATATSSAATSRPLTNGGKQAPLRAMATSTSTPASSATTSNQAKLDRPLQSNNNQHAAAQTPTPALAKPTVFSDNDASSPAAAAGASASASVSANASAGAGVGTSSSLSPSAPAKCAGKSVATQQEVDEVARLFEEKPEAFEKWLTERAPPEALSRLHEFIESRKPHKRPSVTSDLFQQWMASPTVQQVSEGECKCASGKQRGTTKKLPVASNKPGEFSLKKLICIGLRLSTNCLVFVRCASIATLNQKAGQTPQVL